MWLKVDLLKIVCTLVIGLPGLANWRRLMTSSKRTWQREEIDENKKCEGWSYGDMEVSIQKQYAKANQKTFYNIINKD